MSVGNGNASNYPTGESSSNAIPITDDPSGSGAETEIDLDELLKTTSAICIEKQHAAGAIGTIFVATRRHFLPYVEAATVELVGLVEHYSDGVRKSAFESLFAIVQVFYQLSEPAEWVAGLPSVSY